MRTRCSRASAACCRSSSSCEAISPDRPTRPSGRSTAEASATSPASRCSTGCTRTNALPRNLITPTTKESTHDRPITPTEIIREGWLTPTEWEYASSHALQLFAFGQQRAAQHGLILVDTKYEFGVTPQGEVILIDEIHTPDSSRYWLAPTYEQRLAEGREPDMVDKEFFRLWFRERCDPYKDKTLPTPPSDLIAELASRYIQLYEAITGNLFGPDMRPLEATVMEAIAR